MDRKVDRRGGPKVDRRGGPKVDPRAGRWEGHLGDRKEALRVDHWGGPKVDPRAGRRAARTVARKVGLVVLQAAWVEALVLGLREPLVAPRLKIPGSAV